MSYAAAYLGTKPIISLSSSSGDMWVRPTDWPTLPTLGAGENKFVGVYGVDPAGANYVSVLVAVSTGTWTIDWGDGTTDSGLTSNVKRDHLYDYASVSSTATALEGWKPVTVTITTSGGNITTLSLNQKHSQSGLPSSVFRVNWLDISVNAPSMTSLVIAGSSATVQPDKLQQVTIGAHSLSSYTHLFKDLPALQSVPLFNTATATNMTSMFENCHTLRSIPLLNTALVTNMTNMFKSCYNLITLPLLNLASVTNLTSMFEACYSLGSIPLFNTASATNMTTMFKDSGIATVPLLPTSTVTNMSSMFYGCSSLRTTPLFVTTAVTNMSFMFYNCYNLQYVPLFVTTSVTNMSYMFYNCRNLRSIPLFNTATVTNMQNIFDECNSLRSIPQLNTAAITSSVTFYRCYSLTVGRTNGMRFAVNYSGCKLTATEINAIFTGLGTASGSQIVNVSSNMGSATCDQTIATAKGWTVTV